jgi:serine-type D-Ala-D-Ala carboxypeptidase/endopeptidase (penicillin-binding protein 4)
VGGLTSIAAALLAGHLTVPMVSPAVQAVPRAAAAPLPGLSPTAALPAPAAVAARLAGPLANPVLGRPRSTVVDASTGRVLLAAGAGEAAPPASTIKIAVAAAALTALPAGGRLTTRVVAAGNTLWLVGGGDPTLTAATGPAGYPAPARLADLAARVRRAGIRAVGRVVGDGTLFTGPTTAPGWHGSYVTTGNVTPVSGLEVDGGRSAPGSAGPRAPDPTLAAASAFAAALRRAGVRVAAVGTGASPRTARPVAAVASPTIPVLIQRMLTYSDDDQAEAFGRLVARARGLPPTFAGATRAVIAALKPLGIPTAGLSLADTSGLSTADRATPAMLVAILRAAAGPGRPTLRPLLTGLPVAGFSGTLAGRYTSRDDAAGAGDVRAKTGSLDIVTSLAGEVVDADGRLLLFAFLAPVAQSAATSAALDRAASALAGCGCPPPPAAARTEVGHTRVGRSR